MAEKNSKSKSSESKTSTTATTSEKTPKTTTKKVETKTAKAEPATKASSAKTATTAKKPTAATATSKTSGEKATTAKASSTKSTTPKTTASNKTSVTESKAESKKAPAKTETAKSTAKVPTKAEVAKSASKETAKTTKSEKATETAKAKPAEKTAAPKATEKTTTAKATAKESAKNTKTTEIKKASSSDSIPSAVNAYTKTDSNAKPKTTKADSNQNAVKATAQSQTAKAKSQNQLGDKNAKKSANAKDAQAEVLATKKPDNNKGQSKDKATSKINFASIFAKKESQKPNKQGYQGTQTAKTDKSKNQQSNNTKKLSLKEKLIAIVANDNQNNQSKIGGNNANTKTTLTVKDFVTNKKLRLYAITALALLLLFIMILTISLSVVAANKDKLPGGSAYTVKDNSLIKGSSYDYEYRTTAAAGYTEEFLGYVDRKIPEYTGKTESFVAKQYYPTYGHTPSGVLNGEAGKLLRDNLIKEAAYLAAAGTRHNSGGSTHPYNSMDENGNLLYKELNDDGTVKTTKVVDDNGQRQLYKHYCAVGMYYGDVSDEEKAIIKRMTFNPRSFHNHEMYNVTGIYAPAGEVIKIEISKEDMEKTGGIKIHIGQALYNRKANNIWTAKGQMQRFPVILNTMDITKTTAVYDKKREVYVGYVGSFLGGPLYVYNESTTFTVTVSGGVRYSHFILGHTTPEDFEINKASSAPYFDLEVWDNGCLHSGPKKHADRYSYDDLYKVAILWDQVTSVTTTGNNQNIVFLYDPFVAAGAAVAFPGQYSVNCPDGWMSSSLNYEGLVKGGSWGNFHEYHHNFQGYGVGNGGEVTNNALTLVSYALFTKISANRGINGCGSSGLGGWNSYTSATWALNEILKLSDDDPNTNPSNGAQGLTLYATLLHNFGADAFMQVRKLGGGQSYLNYFNKWEQVTHNNMTYYFKEILKANDYNGNIGETSNPDYPMFVPVSSVYQTGRSYIYDDEYKYFKTMQPYVIPYGQKFVIDLSKYVMEADGTHKSGSIVIPNGFTYKIKSVSQPENGSITKEGDYLYTYTPNTMMQSGDIIVTLQITKDDNEFKVADIDLVLGFEQSHELTGRMLERTIYEFNSEQTTTTAKDVFENGYSGYTNKIETDNKNTTQNSNTEVWLTADERSALVANHSILEIKGKMFINETAEYRFMLRGRGSTALFIYNSETKKYEYAAKYENQTNNNVFPVDKNGNPTNADAYKDFEFEADTWVYFKLVLVVESRVNSFIGLGFGKFTPEGGSYDEYGNLISWQDKSVTVAAENAYRESYQFTDNRFVSEYFYTKQYKQSYKETEKIITTKQTVVSSKNYEPFDSRYDISNICDGDLDTNINSKAMIIDKDNYFEVVVKFDKPITANKFRIHYSKKANAFINSRPKNYTLEISSDISDEKNWKTVAEIKDAACANYMHTTTFDDFYTFQYYRLRVTDTYYLQFDQQRFIVIHDLQFLSQLELSNGTRTAVGDKKIKLFGTWNIQNTPSKFGRVYIGKENSSIEFTFTGTRLILFSTINYGTNFEVYIDGKKVNSINIEESTAVCKESYISQELKNKSHTVVIKCLGEANIESISVIN